MKKVKSVIVSILISGLLMACGGGSGGGVAPGVSINQNNVVEISSLALGFALLGEGYSDDVESLLSTDDHNCVDAGDVTITGSISNPPAVGDTIRVTFNNCQEFGEITDGSMSITITQVSPNFDGTPPYTLNVDVVINNLSTQDINLGLTAITNGDMSIHLSETLAGDISVAILGNSLSLQFDSDYMTLSNFMITSITNGLTGDYSFEVDGTIDSNLIGGSVSFDTTSLFAGNINVGAGDPTAGVLHVTTSIDNSQALLTAQPDGINIQIEVDADGDGAYESTVWTTWADL